MTNRFAYSPERRGRFARFAAVSPVARIASRRGFTFAEVLAAMLFVAIAIPVAVEGIQIANRAGVVSERKRKAAELADLKLSEIALTEEWREKPEQEGTFENEWSGYRWKLSTESWDDETMTVVRVEVFYKVQEQEYSVALSTLATTESEEESE